MCGIVGYVRSMERSAGAVKRPFERLEYRGYDSAGIAVSDLRDGENRIEILEGKRPAPGAEGDDGQWKSGKRHLWYRSHPLGNPRGAFSGKRSPPLFQRQTDRCGP